MLNLLKGCCLSQPPALATGNRLWLAVEAPVTVPEVFHGVEGQDSVQVSGITLETACY